MILTLIIISILLTLLRPLYKILLTLYHHFRPLNLKTMYGQGWAIVTGATDGIGFGFCQVLASQGYNVCLISRNLDKLQAKVVQLRNQFGEKVEYKTICADFTQSHREYFFEPIFEELDTIKPVLLINNVGIADVVKVQQQSLSSMKDIISVNCLPMAAFTSYFISRCQKDKYKGGIVNLSSYSMVSPMPYMSLYAGTKAFNDIFSRAVSSQVPEIDSLSVRAMLVQSNATKAERGLMVPTSRECAEDSLKYLGHCKWTAGHLKHQIVSHVTEAMPEFLLEIIGKRQAKKVYEQYKTKNKTQ